MMDGDYPVDSGIHWINHYLLNNYYLNLLSYLTNSDLFNGECYPSLELLGPCTHQSSKRCSCKLFYKGQ